MTASERIREAREELERDRVGYSVRVDVHEGGQLRLGCVGDQLEVLPLDDERVPVSDGPALTAPAVVELVRGLEEV